MIFLVTIPDFKRMKVFGNSIHFFWKKSSWGYQLAANIVVLCCVLLSHETVAQNKTSLEDKRKKLTHEIEITNKLLSKTKKSKSTTFEQFVTLQNQIERRESLIQTIDNEINESEESISRNSAVIEALSGDIAQMREEYGKTLRTAFRRKTLTNPLLFILSAENINQAFRRWLFLRKYNHFRMGQAEAISFTKEILSKKLTSLEHEKSTKEQLRIEMTGQRGTLTTELVDKNDLLKSLSQNEEKLLAELKEKQTAKLALDNSIERIISTEIRKKEEKEATKKRATADKKAQPPPPPAAPEKNAPEAVSTPKVNQTPPGKPITKPTVPPPSAEVEEDALSMAFKKQKGSLPWPVEDGFVARAFGRQKHPTLKNIDITNNGIDIRTSDDAPVRAIFDGKVAGVQYIPGHDYTIIIQHGNYYTVYSNLSQTSLNKGDQVGAGNSIGTVSTNPISGAAELHFELWKEKERMNPAIWIK